jgi:Ca2+-binding EF-hand superfamily protein
MFDEIDVDGSGEIDFNEFRISFTSSSRLGE